MKLLKELLNERDDRIRFSVYSYGSDQTLFSDRAKTPEEAAQKAIDKLIRSYHYKESQLKYTIKPDWHFDHFINFPDVKVSIEFGKKGVGSNQYDIK